MFHKYLVVFLRLVDLASKVQDLKERVPQVPSGFFPRLVDFWFKKSSAKQQVPRMAYGFLHNLWIFQREI